MSQKAVVSMLAPYQNPFSSFTAIIHAWGWNSPLWWGDCACCSLCNGQVPLVGTWQTAQRHSEQQGTSSRSNGRALCSPVVVPLHWWLVWPRTYIVLWCDLTSIQVAPSCLCMCACVVSWFPNREHRDVRMLWNLLWNPASKYGSCGYCNNAQVFCLLF
jgi:hypothetical protein